MNFLSKENKVVCPNDRQLALRATVRAGWSAARSDPPLSERERAAIAAVVRRADSIERLDQRRIARLLQRLDGVVRGCAGASARGAEGGQGCCAVCGARGRLLAPLRRCLLCALQVCSACATPLPPPAPALSPPPTHPHPRLARTTGTGISTRGRGRGWVCLVCGEWRELWKKSGAWFYRALPVPLPATCAARAEDPTCTRTHPTPCTRTPESKDVDDGAGDATGAEGSPTSPGAGTGTGTGTDTGTRPNAGSTRRAGSVRARPTPAPALRDPQEEAGSSASAGVAGLVRRLGSLRLSERRRRGREHGLSNGRWNGGDTATGATPHSASDLDPAELVSSPAPCPTPAPPPAPAPAPAPQVCPATTIPDCGLGTVEVAVRHVRDACALEVRVVRARRLPPADLPGLAHPFCLLRLLPTEDACSGDSCGAGAGAGAGVQLRTRTVHKTRHPEFNETLRFYGVTATDLRHTTLHIQVLDDDVYGCDMLGCAAVALGEGACGEGGEAGEGGEGAGGALRLALCAPAPGDADAGAAPRSLARPRIQIALAYCTRRRALAVHVLRASRLPAKDSNGYSDPFVKLQLEPDPHHKKYRTSIKWRNLNPVFNEEFLFESRPTELSGQRLTLTVWDRDYGKPNDFLGQLQLGAHSKGARLAHWLDVLRYPDHAHTRWHCLADTNLL